MKRFRLLLVALAIATVAVLGVASTSSAEGEGNYKDHATKECAEKLAKGETVEDCQKAPNPLVPAPNELLWGAIGFLIVFGVLAKFGMPAIKAGMQARTDRIQGDLDAAEAQRTEAQGILDEYKAQLADARQESARIIEEARQAADQVKADLQAKAEADIAEMKARALTEIEAAKDAVRGDLQREVTALAIGAAEQVVGRNLDADTNTALVEAYINSVGADR